MDHLIALKNEQSARIVLRDTALYVFIGTIFGVYAAEGQAGANRELVELIRACSMVVSAIMLSIYMSNDYYISKIARFVCDKDSEGEFKRWENYHRRGGYYQFQKLLRFILVLLMFGGWAVYQGLPVFSHGTAETRIIAMGGGAIVLVELIFFVVVYLDRRL